MTIKKRSRKSLMLPALKGRIGSWAFYTTLMKFSEIRDHVKISTDFYTNEKLSDMVQRAVRSDRTDKIADYLLNEPERFFSAMVVAVFEGAPDWHPFTITAGEGNNGFDRTSVDLSVIDAFGFLSLTGKENLFPLDGQHRLSGIKSALSTISGNGSSHDLASDEMSVIMVAHEPSAEGRMRSRRLFTVLNKRAVPVKKHETIALDEDDVMAISTRHLVEDYEKLSKKDIVAFRTSINLHPSDQHSFTTIQTIYEVLQNLFLALSHRKKEELQFNRPDDKWLEVYNKCATHFFEKLGENFREVKNSLNPKRKGSIVDQYRNENGGHVLFRPIGLQMFSELVAAYIRKSWTKEFEVKNSEAQETLEKAIDMIDQAVDNFSDIPTNLSQLPYRDLIWLTDTKRIAAQRKTIVRDLILNRYDLLPDSKKRKLKRRLSEILGSEDQAESILSQY